MKNMLKKIALACRTLTLGLVISLLAQPPLGFSAYDDGTATGSTNLRTGNVKITDTGIYDSAGSLRYTPGATNKLTDNTAVTGGQESMGSVGVILSTANTSGFSAGQLYYAYLSGNQAALEGSVLVATTSIVNKGVSVAVSPTATGLPIAGLASAAVSTGSVVGVISYGWAMALTTGTVSVGDFLQTSALSRGYLESVAQANITSSTNTIGVALVTGNASGGRIRIKLK